ncbi:MAG: hypothetical protein KKG47_11590 [Proteobacteria bacterium]|nr:hypothetical protein [Pseudomonadota bacterium]MBU1739454.1 hypothetical protein [Pseudomonadota bacterium]
MDISHTNTLEDFFIAAVIMLASIVAAQFLYHTLRGMIEKSRFGTSTTEQTKSLLQIPGFFRLFILIRGCLLTFDLFRVDPAALELAAAARTSLALIGNLFLYFGLIATTRAGFTAWATKHINRQDRDNPKSDRHHKKNPVEAAIRKTRTLNNLLLLPLGVLIFLPELDLTLPKEEILYGAALLFLINALVLSFAATALQKNKVVSPPVNKIARSSYELELLESMSGKDQNFPIILDIVSLFLDIVKHHLGAGKDAPCRFTMVEHDVSRSKYLFELEVPLHSIWKKRRITVGRLAADSGSRSTCFFVIYNEYLVVKIPPEPITDPTEYLESLKHEAAIAKQVDMDECIIPSISVILKYVDPSMEAGNSIDTPEEIARISLRRHPEHYRFLKVGESFAYFMDMSKYYFLQKVITTLHETTASGGRVPFLRIKPSLEGIVGNLLNLLARISNKGVALRDLKPDNLLVAGDRNNYPGFLNRPAEYVIGLIDIETAVVYGNPPRKIISQPQSGGTPRYATPSHFFKNNLILHLYGEIADILHLQDWYGTIAVIFKVITARYLFKEAAITLPPIAQKLNALKVAEEVVRFAMDASCYFWRTADAEFYRKTAEERKILDELTIQIDSPAAAMFKERIAVEQNNLAEAIRKMVTSQAINPADAHKLLQASAQEISSFSGQWQKLCATREDLQKRLPQTLQMLKELHEKKAELEKLGQTLQLFNAPAPKITALLLLETMYSLVNRKMFREEWKKLPAKSLADLMGTSPSNLSETLLEATGAEYQASPDGPTEKI